MYIGSLTVAGPCSELRSESDFNQFFSGGTTGYLVVHREEKDEWVRCSDDIGGDYPLPPLPTPVSDVPPDKGGKDTGGPITVAPPVPAPPGSPPVIAPPVAKIDPPSPAPTPPAAAPPPPVDSGKPVAGPIAPPPPPFPREDARKDPQSTPDPFFAVRLPPSPTPKSTSVLDERFGDVVEPVHGVGGRRADFSIAAPNGAERIRTAEAAERGTTVTIPTSTEPDRNAQAALEEKWNAKAETVLSDPSASPDKILSMLQDLVALDPDVKVPGLDDIVGTGIPQAKGARRARRGKTAAGTPAAKPVASGLGAFPGDLSSDTGLSSLSRRNGGRGSGSGIATSGGQVGSTDGGTGAASWNEDDIVVGDSAIHPKLVGRLMQAWAEKQSAVDEPRETSETRRPASLDAKSKRASLGGVSGGHWMTDEGARASLGLIGLGMLLAGGGWWISRRRARGVVTSRSHHDSRHRPPR